MANNLKALKVDLKKWNDEEFRSVIVKKNQLLLDLNELDSIEESRQLLAEEKLKKEKRKKRASASRIRKKYSSKRNKLETKIKTIVVEGRG